MKTSKTRLRREAEARLASSSLRHTSSPPSQELQQELLHELQVHRIELEMQNEELRRSQIALEESRDRYMDLYEYAPIAYLTLTLRGVVSGINLTGAQLLGEDRRSILRRDFEHYVIEEDRECYRQMLAESSLHCGRRTCAITLRRADRSILHAQLDCVPGEQENIALLRLAVTDLTERKQAEAQIASLAFYDPLTHLPNRRLLLDRLTQATHASHRTRRHGAILALDLDGFKALNDTHGHDAGDRILCQTARRLTGCVREVDTVGRLGGDEFVILLEDLDEEANRAAAQAQSVGNKILAALVEPYLLARQEYRSSSSMGITLFGSQREPVSDILKRADLALYHSKSAGRGVLQIFNPELEAAFQARLTLETELRQGLEQGQFLLHYQPQVDEQGAMLGVEALVRWQHPVRGLLRPAEFLPLAEEKGLVEAIGQFVLETACAQMKVWAARPETAHLTLAVNISTPEFSQPQLVQRTLEIVRRSGIDPGKLFIEVTESLLLRNLDDTIAKMQTLKAHGLRFSLDDFGMGFSSLAYLKSLPLDQLKIDVSFVREVLTDSNDAAIVRTIMTLGRSMGLSVVAEGVETEAQQNFLIDCGCRVFQGNLFGKPRLAQDLNLNPDELRYRTAG